MPLLLRARAWGAHLLMVAALASAIALGLWQLHVWQAARAAEARDISQDKPLTLASVMSGDDPFPGQYLGQPVSLRGQWIPAGTLYVADRTLDGRRGYWVMTPVMVGRSAMPVVRGWTAKPQAAEPHGSVEVTGWLQPSEGTGAVDDKAGDDVIAEMRIGSIVEHVDADLYSGFVVSRRASSASDPAYAGLRPVTPSSIPEISNLTSLRNLLYAFQWWVFGGMAIYIWVRWCRDQLEADRAGLEPSPAG